MMTACLLVMLKEKGGLWYEIANHSPSCTSLALFMHYSAKIRHKSPRKALRKVIEVKGSGEKAYSYVQLCPH